MQPQDDELEGEFVLDKAAETLVTEPSNTPPSPTTSKSKNPYIGRHNRENPSTPHFFSSYCHYPKNVWFEDQEEDEEIILIIRRHFITNVPWIFFGILFALFPIILFPFLLQFSPFGLPSASVQSLAILFYYLGIFGFLLLNFTLWYFNVGIVTNIRIRDIDIHGLLYRHIAEAKLETVQDISYDQIGFVRSVFNYGDVFIQTAGTIANVEFDKAPKPATVARIIGDIVG